MKRNITFLILMASLLIFSISRLKAQQTLAEKLGYGPDAKLLIVHADDLGVAHAQNMGSFLALKMGMVNSASIMMPCPWVAEVADFAKEHPQADLGLHLTLTCEWKHMKWGPVASKDKVSSLIDSLGFFHSDCATFAEKAKVEEAEIELRAQIEQAYKMGIRPTHLDAHMGCLLWSSPELFGIYLKLGRAYKIPVMVGRFFLKAAPQEFKDLIKPTDLVVEKVMTAEPKNFANGMADYYEEVLSNLTTGIQVLLIHTAFDNAEMQALAIDHPDWGSQWRQADFDFFTSARCKKIFAEQNIQLLSWRELQQAIYGME